MKTQAALLIAVFLASCASTAPMPPAAPLLHDEAFTAPVKPVDSAAALAPSPAMREYLRSKRVSQAFAGDRRRQLIDALYHGDLKLEYDAAITRTAAEAFDARSGNCLALVLMTSAFAKELGRTVHYQAVNGEDIWDRNGELYIGIGHVNLVLEDNKPRFSYFKQGQVALREGRFEAARRLFSKEIERAPYHHEFEYWLAVTYMERNDAERATLHLKRAMYVSTTRKDHDLYAGKLDRLKALRQQ